MQTGEAAQTGEALRTGAEAPTVTGPGADGGDPADRAGRLRALLADPAPLVLVEVWDVLSARAVAAAGAGAVATSAAAMAWSLGSVDGSGAAVAGFVDTVTRICAAVAPLPVTVDIEAGFGTTPAQVAATVRKVVLAGAAGIDLGDRVLPAGGPGPALVDLVDQQVRIRAARAAAEALGVALVITARTEVLTAGVGEPDERLDLVASRAAAYAAAGADCVLVAGPLDVAAVGELASRLTVPLAVEADPASPPVAELAGAGAARIGLGTWPARAVLGRLSAIAQSVLVTGGFGKLDGAVSEASARSLIGEPLAGPTVVLP